MLEKGKIFCSCLAFLLVNFSCSYSFCDLIMFQLQLLGSRIDTTELVVLDSVNTNCELLKLTFQTKYEMAKPNLLEDKRRKEIYRNYGINSIKLRKLQTLSHTVFLPNSNDNIDMIIQTSSCCEKLKHVSKRATCCDLFWMRNLVSKAEHVPPQ